MSAFIDLLIIPNNDPVQIKPNFLQGRGTAGTTYFLPRTREPLLKLKAKYS